MPTMPPVMRILHDHAGSPIRLTDERWTHILEHPEMKGMEHAVGETLGGPEQVVRSLSDDEARLYYRLYYRRYPNTAVGDKLLCVVVKDAGGGAFVLTAYLTDKVKTGEVLWTPRKS